MKTKKLILLPLFALGGATLSGCSFLCTVTWVDWDGTVLEVDKHVCPGNKFEYNGETPKRDADAQYTYEFSNWNHGRRILRSVTVTAQYTKTVNTYSVRWLSDTGSLLKEDKDIPYGTLPSYKGETPKKASTAQYDYTFSGWSPKVTKVTGNAKYTAQFTSETRAYTVTWLDWDGTVLEVDKKVPYGQTPSFDRDNPTREDDLVGGYSYEFTGWTSAIKPVTGDVIYRASYTKHELVYNVTLKVEGEEDIVVPAHMHSTVELDKMSDDYYDMEWFLDEDHGKKISDYKCVDILNDITFYGVKVGLHEFEITYDLKGGESEEFPETVNYEEEIDLANVVPTREGYTFAGWKQNGKTVQKLSKITSDVKLEAQWTANSYTITFDSDEFEYNELGVKYDGTFTLPKPQKRGYKFNGWREVESGALVDDTSKYTYSRNIVVTPDIEIETYNVTYDLDGGVVADQRTTYTVEDYEGLGIASKVGYTFQGWQVAGKNVTDLHEFTGDVTVVAKWEANPFKIHFNYNGGTIQHLVTYMDGEEKVDEVLVAGDFNVAEYLVLEDKEGYQFAGWDGWTDEEISEDLVLTAKWNEVQENCIPVTLEDDNIISFHNLNSKFIQFTSLKDQTVYVQSAGGLSLMAKADGMKNYCYDADGINFCLEIDVEAGKSYVVEINGARNVDGNSDIIIQNVLGEGYSYPENVITAEVESESELEYAYDDEFTGAPELVRNGYIFVGWIDADENLYEEGSTLKELEDLELTAVWY